MDAQVIIALLTLVALEIILGVDNIIFISILSGKLPVNQQEKARIIGLVLAMLTRIGLLFSISLIMKLEYSLFSVLGQDISGRDLILIIGGLFLIAKSTHEIHNKLEGMDGEGNSKISASFNLVVLQIILLDIVFSIDSVITAIGMVNQLWVMISAVIISVIFMLAFSGKIASFVNRRPTIKMLALSFLLLIGVSLIAEGFHQHIPKGYIYFSMAFSLFVESLNLKMRKKQVEPVHLRAKYAEK